jgi:uncharacterized protein YciI
MEMTMPAVVFCQDSEKARFERERSYDAHIQYLRAIRERILFAGPLATTDGARAQGDESLVGSLFAVDESASTTAELMQGDPYVLNGVWDRVSVFQAAEAFGQWVVEGPSKAPGGLYAALAQRGGPPLIASELALFGARLRPEPERKPDHRAEGTTWSAVAIFSAKSLVEARSMLARDADEPERLMEVWALPIAVGTWIRAVQVP